MLASWANTIVLVAIGLSLGAVAALARILTPPAFREVLNSKKAGEGLFRASIRRADEQAEIVRTGPRSFRLAAYAQLALVGVLLLVLWLSPVELGWWVLLISLGIGALTMWGLFRLARAGRLVAAGPSRLDPLSGIDFVRKARSDADTERAPR